MSSASAYRAALEALYARAARGIQPGLERMREALGRLDRPDRDLEVVHVAGTNGKGSVARMVAEGWAAQAPGVGLFTSPHLHRLTERFAIDGAPATPEALVAAWRAIDAPLADLPLSFFEVVTCLAFVRFRQAGVRRVVLEVGLGGRLDSTNVVERPRVCAITRVGLDHQAYLGDDLASIAWEKAGILEPGVPCVIAPQASEAEAVIARVAAERGAPLRRPGFTDAPFEVRLGERRWTGGPPRLAGAHQRQNAAVAVGVLWELGADDAAIRRGLDAPWPGRLETVDGVLLDVAHNPDGARALAAHLAGSGPVTLVFGAMADKAHEEMLEALRPRAARVVLTRAALARAADPRDLGEADHCCDDVAAAVSLARGFAEPVVVTGSVFVVAEARAALLGLEADPPIAL